MVLEANITPVLVLTKIDLAEDPSVFIEALSQRFPEIAQVAVDALSEGAVAALTPWCTQGQTIVLLGSLRGG